MEKGHLEMKVHPPRGDEEMNDAVKAIRKVIEHVGELQDGGS